MRIHPPPPPNRSDTSGGAGGDSGGDPPADLQEKVLRAIKTVYDPEIPINIYDLGLIYDVKANQETGVVAVQMTLTTPNCPEAQSLPMDVRQSIEAIPEVKEANVEIVWDPPWDKEKMSDAAKLQLGLL